MSEEKIDSETTDEKRKPKKGRALGCFFILLLIAGLGYLAYNTIGKKVLLERKTDAYLREARSFIENRKFNFAEKSLVEARELNPESHALGKLQEELDQARIINLYEKNLAKSLQSKDWSGAQSAISNLRLKQPNHPAIAPAIEDMKEGERQEKLEKLKDSLAQAQKAKNLPEVVKFSDRLIKHDPENPSAVRWKEISKKASSDIAEAEKNAKLIYEQALLVDKGFYSSELNNLALKAKNLSSREVYQEFYNKVSKYPRIIRFPNEYSNLQDAVDSARPIDTIQISEGAYHAPIQVSKEVKIVGEEGKNVVIHSAGEVSPVVYVSKGGRLDMSNISMKHVDKSEGESAYSLLVVEGEATLASCVLFESVGHGVHVTNGGKLIAKSCRIEGNRWSGVVSTGAASLASLTESVVAKNGHNGIDAWAAGKIELFDSFSEENAQSGVVATKQGGVKVIGSTIRNNKHTGIYLKEGGNASLRTSELSGNLLAGGFGDGSGLVSFESMKVLRNSVAGLVLTTGTVWKGAEESEFIDNAGQNIWKDAEFRISEILKESVPEGVSAEGEGETDPTESKSEDVPEEAPSGEKAPE